MKVVVLCGEFAMDQNEARASAAQVVDAIKRLGHETYLIDFDIEAVSKIREIAPDAAFQLSQGKSHSDGSAQTMLELIGIPYTGSRPYAAAIINHKTLCKRLWLSAGLRTPEYFELSYEEYKTGGFNGFLKKAVDNGLSLPLVVKAPTQSARIGMTFVIDEGSFIRAEDSFRYDDVLLIERYVEGRFLTHGLIEIDGKLTTLPPVEVIDVTDDKFKKYDGFTKAADHELTPDQLAEINYMSLEAARLTCASGVARLDYHLSDGKLYLLEINACPGLMRDCSDIIKCIDAAGLTYDELIGMILATAR